MPIYNRKNKLNSATNNWSNSLSTELRTFSLITWTTLHLLYLAKRSIRVFIWINYLFEVFNITPQWDFFEFHRNVNVFMIYYNYYSWHGQHC